MGNFEGKDPANGIIPQTHAQYNESKVVSDRTGWTLRKQTPRNSGLLGPLTDLLGGGMMRDVMLQEIPFVLKKHIYAVAAIAGAATYYFLIQAGAIETIAYSAGWMMTVTRRLLAMQYKWNLPRAI